MGTNPQIPYVITPFTKYLLLSPFDIFIILITFIIISSVAKLAWAEVKNAYQNLPKEKRVKTDKILDFIIIIGFILILADILQYIIYWDGLK